MRLSGNATGGEQFLQPFTLDATGILLIVVKHNARLSQVIGLLIGCNKIRHFAARILGKKSEAVVAAGVITAAGIIFMFEGCPHPLRNVFG